MTEPPFDYRCLRLLTLLRQEDSHRPKEYLTQLLEEQPPEWVYLHVLIPVVYQAGEKTIQGTMAPQTCCRVLETVRMRLLPLARQRLARRLPLGKKLYASYMPRDGHSIGLLAIGDWLERDGWEVRLPFPPPGLETLAEEMLAWQPDVVAFSCGMPRSVAAARRLIRALRARQCPATIWIGGMAINASESLLQKSEADRTAPNILAFTRALAAEHGYDTLTPANLHAPGL